MFGVATQNGVGLGVGNIPTLTSLAYPQMLNAIVLGAFSGGAPGWMYDDTNQSTLFQDASTPVTALEQPVGLQLDLSQGLVLGPELVVNGDFSSATGWTAESGWTISGGAANYSGLLSAAANIYQAGIATAGTWYKVVVVVTVAPSSTGLYVRLGPATYSPALTVGTNAFYLLAGSTGLAGLQVIGGAVSVTCSVDSISIKRIAGNHRYQPTSANRPTWSARYNLLLATASLSTQSVTTVATNYVLYFTGSGTVTLSGTSTGTLSAGSNTITCTAGTLTLTVTGSVLTADLRPANQAVGLLPQYQAVVTASNYDSVGFPAGLRWNGSNSWMQNASVDFSGTNKVSLFVGVRKQSGAAQGLLTELGTNVLTTAHTFGVYAPNGAGSYAVLANHNAVSGLTSTTYTEPITNVLSAKIDCSAAGAVDSQIFPRVNGAIPGTNAVVGATGAGAGLFSNAPAYFGARAGSSLFFNGLTFSNVCIGIALSASQIAAFEAWTNSRARAY